MGIYVNWLFFAVFSGEIFDEPSGIEFSGAGYKTYAVAIAFAACYRDLNSNMI
jgi:hypothetical protein